MTRWIGVGFAAMVCTTGCAWDCAADREKEKVIVVIDESRGKVDREYWLIALSEALDSVEQAYGPCVALYVSSAALANVTIEDGADVRRRLVSTVGFLLEEATSEGCVDVVVDVIERWQRDDTVSGFFLNRQATYNFIDSLRSALKAEDLLSRVRRVLYGWLDRGWPGDPNLMSDALAMIAGISMPEDVDILVSTFWRYALKGDAEMMWRTVEAIGFYEEHGVEALRAIKDNARERSPCERQFDVGRLSDWGAA